LDFVCCVGAHGNGFYVGAEVGRDCISGPQKRGAGANLVLV